MKIFKLLVCLVLRYQIYNVNDLLSITRQNLCYLYIMRKRLVFDFYGHSHSLVQVYSQGIDSQYCYGKDNDSNILHGLNGYQFGFYVGRPKPICNYSKNIHNFVTKVYFVSQRVRNRKSGQNHNLVV